MGALQIVLLIAGTVIFILSFVIPVTREEVSQETRELAQEEIKRLVAREVEGVKDHVDSVVGQSAEDAMEKTERELEKLSNEKIMAVSDYSDTVISEIHKNHEEVMFLYDMLNDKHTSLKNAVSQINETVGQVNDIVKNVKESRRDAEAAVSRWKQIQLESMDRQQEDAGIMRITRRKEEAEAQQLLARQEALRLEEAERREQAALAKAWEPEPAETREPLPLPLPEEPKAPVLRTEVPEVSAPVAEAEEEQESGNDRILSRYKQGKSTVAIAKELGLGVGEVKLVIDLYKNHA